MIFFFVLTIYFQEFLSTGANEELPQIQPFSFPGNLKIGGKTTLMCATINGKPPFSFRWLKDETALDPKSFSDIRIIEGDIFSNLILDPIDLNSPGNYTCEVKNKIGMASSSSSLNIQVPPSWLSTPQDVTALERGSVSLQCKAKGSPVPRVTWTKLEDKVQHPTNSSVLIFNQVERVHAGKYRCTADNGLGPPLLHTVTLTVHSPAKFAEKFAVVRARRGDSASLTCEALGDHPVGITWRKDDRYLSKTGEARYEIFESQTPDGLKSELVIRETGREDGSLYTCLAENPYGKDERSIKVQVMEVPGRPLDVKIQDVWSRSVSVSWAPPYSGNSPISKYVVQYWRDTGGAPQRLQEHNVTSSQTSVLLKKLEAGARYSLALVAENALGRGEPSPSVPFTTGEEEPSGVPLNLVVQPKGGSSLFVTWKAPPPDKWNGQLRGFYVGFKASGRQQPYSFRTVEAAPTEPDRVYEHVITHLRRDTEYEVVVRAFNGAGSGPHSQPVVVRTLAGELPHAPSVYVAETTQNAIKIVWRAPASPTPVTGHVVYYRRGSEGRWQQVPIMSAEDSSYVLSGLEPAVLYQLYVVAANMFGEGDPSELISVKTGHLAGPGHEVMVSAGSPHLTTGSGPAHRSPAKVLPFYEDLSLVVPTLASGLAVVLVFLMACFWVRRVRKNRDYRHSEKPPQFGFGGGQRYMDMNKQFVGPGGGTLSYPTPYATVPMDVPPDDPTQEMCHFIPQNMRDRPLPNPHSLKKKNKRDEAHIYDPAE